MTALTWFTLGNEPELPPFLIPTSGSSPSSGGSSSTSGGPGSGSGGSASGSGSGGPNGFGGSTLGGGLPFPKGGLHGLGLPTRGATAINGLKPYAISTQNAVSKALGLLNGLSSGASTAAADVSAAADSLAAATSGKCNFQRIFDSQMSVIHKGLLAKLYRLYRAVDGTWRYRAVQRAWWPSI